MASVAVLPTLSVTPGRNPTSMSQSNPSARAPLTACFWITGSDRGPVAALRRSVFVRSPSMVNTSMVLTRSTWIPRFSSMRRFTFSPRASRMFFLKPISIRLTMLFLFLPQSAQIVFCKLQMEAPAAQPQLPGRLRDVPLALLEDPDDHLPLDVPRLLPDELLDGSLLVRRRRMSLFLDGFNELGGNVAHDDRIAL